MKSSKVQQIFARGPSPGELALPVAILGIAVPLEAHSQ
jgi:hypothetical protein